MIHLFMFVFVEYWIFWHGLPIDHGMKHDNPTNLTCQLLAKLEMKSVFVTSTITPFFVQMAGHSAAQ